MKKNIPLILLFFITLSYHSKSQSSRIIEIIDDRDKPNLTMSNTKNPFYKLIYEAVTTGVKGTKINAYTDTTFKKIISSAEILKIGASEETFPIYPDPENEPDVFYDTTVFLAFDPANIARYVVMYNEISKNEETSYSIYAIAPLKDNWIGNVKVNEQVMFWVKFEDLAEVIGKEIFYSPENAGAQMTYKDFFEKHLFSGRELSPTTNLTRQ